MKSTFCWRIGRWWCSVLSAPFADTVDERRAELSIFQWRRDGCKEARWTLSMIGWLNGLLPLLPGSPVLVMHVPSNLDTSKGTEWQLSFKRKWW